MLQHPKELAETSASFFNSTGFEYRSQESALDFGLLRQRQKERIADLFRSDPFFTEEKLLCELERVQEESNHFIRSLLQQLADQCRKTRTLQVEHEATLRNKNSDARRLAEQNMELASILNAQRSSWEQERSELQREARQAQKTSKSLRRECDGLRKLLQEYEGEFQVANTRMDAQHMEISVGMQREALMVDKIDELSLALNSYECQHSRALDHIRELESQLQISKQSQLQLQKALKSFEEAELNSQGIVKQCSELRRQQAEQTDLIEHLERKLLQANGEVMKQESRCTSIQSANSQDIQQFINRQSQLKTVIQELQLKAKLTMDRLKENYAKKMKKVVAYYQREVKTLKSSFSSMKESLQKQMLLFAKLMQRDFKEKSRCILSHSAKN